MDRASDHASSRSRRSAAPSRPLIDCQDSSALALLPVKEVVGDVRHARLLAYELAGLGGGIAALRIHPLDEADALKNARRVVRCRGELKPGNGVGLRTAFENGRNHFAAAAALPRWTAIVDADDALTLGVQHRLGRDEDPACAVPAVDLHALCVGVKRD